jgi:hypothetical protein
MNMTQPFYDRLETYFRKVGEVLRGEADAAAIFPNSTDLGMSRERIYADFLRHHLPAVIFFSADFFSVWKGKN